MRLRDRIGIAIGIAKRVSDKPSYVLIANLPDHVKNKMVEFCDKQLEEHKEMIQSEVKVTIKDD